MFNAVFSLRQIANRFLNALTSNDARAYEYALTEDAGMRVWRWDGLVMLRPRRGVIEYLMNEWATWSEPTLETVSVIADTKRAAVEFRIQAREDGRYVEHNRSAFLSVKGDQVQMIDLYCAEPVPSAHRADWIAPATLDDDAVRRLFDEYEYIADARERLSANANQHLSLRGRLGGSGDAHPGSNGGGNARWSADEADAQIESLIEYHRARNIGFRWHVGPWDTPPDLRERLERHGFVLAGDTACMARVRLDTLDDIPLNPDVVVAQVKPDDDDAIEALLQIEARCFHMTPEQVEYRRPSHFARIKDPKFISRELHFLARVDGVPVAESVLTFRGGVAYLAGASTLPEYRNRKVYSTLLRKRLEIACERGYHVAIIHAEPMSRRIVARYGFREFGRYYLYAWMPVLDMDVIKSLIPDE